MRIGMRARRSLAVVGLGLAAAVAVPRAQAGTSAATVQRAAADTDDCPSTICGLNQNEVRL